MSIAVRSVSINIWDAFGGAITYEKSHYCHFAVDTVYLFHGNRGLHSIHLYGKPTKKPEAT